MCKLTSWCALEVSEQAALVQAVGSVGAILIAVFVPLFIEWLKSRKAKAEQRERMLNAALRLVGPIDALHSSMDRRVLTASPDYDHDDPVISIDPTDGNFEPLISSVLSNITLVLSDLGPLAPHVRELAFELMDLDRFLNSIPAIERSGSPAFYRTNLPDILERISSVSVRAREVLTILDATSNKTNENKDN